MAFEKAETQGVNLLARQAWSAGGGFRGHSSNNGLQFGEFRGWEAFDVGEKFSFAHGINIKGDEIL